MPLQPGTRLGHYNVTTLLGEGGMGQVWQATDTQLNRQVALKILPDAFADDPDRLARFTREAQILASLNHPNIAAIHGIEESEGTRALVQELVEGPTLADRISQGPIPLDEALPIAKQIAEALEAAHEAGVIHRDLKPANIKVREDGTVKVLDFGLAKALAGDAQGPDLSQSPTMTASMGGTREGVILGTAAYMSPEQARGQTLDKRTDIWSFGCVLFEMLTGRAAFGGQTLSDTIANVIEREPAWAALPADLPAIFTHSLRRCVRKNPRQRVHDVADVRLAMEDAFETPVGVAPSAPQPGGWKKALPLAVGVLLVGSLTTGLAVWSVTRPESENVVRFPVSPDGTEPLAISLISPDIAISPDGQMIAYLTGNAVAFGAAQLQVRSLSQLSSQTLVAEGSLVFPFFSPDNAWVGFYDRSEQPFVLKRVPVGGGAPETICELPGGMYGASWGSDGNIIFAAASPGGGGLWRVPALGGEPVRLTTFPDQPLVRADVDLAALPDDTPATLSRVISACLRRDPKQRVHDVADVRLAMEGAFETGVSAAALPSPGPQLRVWQRPIPLALVGLALLALGGLAVGTVMRPGQPSPGSLARFVINTPPDAPLFRGISSPEVAISPDGTRIVYGSGTGPGSTRQLYLRHVDQLDATPLRGTEGGSGPFFSPDGEWVGFHAGDTLKKDSARDGLGFPPDAACSVPVAFAVE